MRNYVTVDGEKYPIADAVLFKKTKVFLSVPGTNCLVMRFLDKVKSDDGSEEQEIPGKGKVCATINRLLFGLLQGKYVDERQETPIRTHYISGGELVYPTDCLVQRMAESVPLEVIVRNVAEGSFVERYGVASGTVFPRPYCEFTLKDDALHDPLVNDAYIELFEIATKPEIDTMREMALAASRIITAFFAEIGIDLIDAKFVFGRSAPYHGDSTNLRLIGELSPDSFRLRAQDTGQILDKDIFRKELPGLLEAYKTVEQKILESYARHHQNWFNQPLPVDADGNLPK